MKRGLSVYFFTCILATTCFAQRQNDLVLTSGLVVEKKLSRSFTASLTNQYTLNQNLDELGYFYYDMGISYKLNGNFSGEVHNRFIQFRNLDNFYDNRQMPYVDLSYSKSRKNFLLTFRSRLQETFYGFHFEQTYHKPALYSRNNVSFSYRINYYINPFISFEIFYPINNPLRKGMDQFRETAGMSYTFNRTYKVETYYQVQNLTNRIHKKYNYVMGITGYYRF